MVQPSRAPPRVLRFFHDLTPPRARRIAAALEFRIALARAPVEIGHGLKHADGRARIIGDAFVARAIGFANAHADLRVIQRTRDGYTCRPRFNAPHARIDRRNKFGQHRRPVRARAVFDAAPRAALVGHALVKHVRGVWQVHCALRTLLRHQRDRQRTGRDAHAVLVELAFARNAAVLTQAGPLELRVVVQEL